MDPNKKDIQTKIDLEEEEIMSRLAQLHSDNFKKLTDIEGIIIRGHILIEHELNVAIAKTILDENEYRVDKFTFSQKLTIAYMLGIGTYFKEELQAINSLRNEIAHSLKYRESLVDLIISRLKMKDANSLGSGDRVALLAKSISFICGSIAIMPKYAREIYSLTILNEKLKLDSNK